MKTRLLSYAAILVTCLTSGHVRAEGQTIQRYYIEAEDCEGLRLYAWDNEAVTGWYARSSTCRAYGAPGRTLNAAIHERASAERRSMSQKLAKPVPPGKYKVFLRTLGPSHADEGKQSRVTIKIGKQEVAFAWNKGGKRFRWEPAQTVTLTEPVDSVTFTANEFSGYGHSTMYEPMQRTIWIDTLYLTSDMNESTPPKVEAETLLRGGGSEDLAPRPTFAADDQKTPRALGNEKLQPILLSNSEGRANMWPNSSLELGMNDGWSFGGYGQPYVFTDKDLDKENPFHGSYSLRVPEKKSPFTRPCWLPAGSDVSVSAYVRGGGPVKLQLIHVEHDSLEPFRGRTIPIKPVLTANATASDPWQRLTATGSLAAGWYYLKFVNTEEIWIDALQFESGTKASNYAPRHEVEGGLRSGQLGNILYQDQTSLDAWFHNSSATRQQASIGYRILNLQDRVIASGQTKPVTIDPGQTLRVPVSIVPKDLGIFSVTYAMAGRKMPEGELVYVKMPTPPEAEPRHQLGANISFNPHELELKSRLGLKWTLTCKTRSVGSAVEYVHPKPDLWQWADKQAALPAKYGMDAVTCFWPHRVPAFMKTKPDHSYRVVRGGHAFAPDLTQWREYAGKVAEHFKDTIRHWCVDDEAELSWPPELFAEVVNTTLDAVGKSAPEVTVGLSGTPEFTEELLKHVDVKKVGFFGGSTFDFHHWESKRVKRISERYGKRWVCYGVGQRPPTNSMYHTLYTYESPRYKAAWMARQIIYLLLVQDVKVAGHYAGVLRNDGRHYGLNKPLCDYDGTPIPWGATFAVMGTLLGDAVPEGEVEIGDTGLLAYLFRLGNQQVAVTWSTAVKDYDHHWKAARRSFEKFSIPTSSVDVKDMYWNSLPDVDKAADSTQFLLDEEPVFIVNAGLEQSEFIKTIQRATTSKRPVEVTSRIVSSEAGPALEVRIRNDSGKVLSNARVDMRSPVNKPVSIGAQWLFAKPISRVGSVENGKSAAVTIPIQTGDRFGIEDGQIRPTVTADGFETASDEWLWLHPADQADTTVDGKSDEWADLPNSTIAYDWAWARFGRTTVQIHDGGEFFSYPPYSLDGRVTWQAAWSGENLTFHVVLEDDQPILGANGEQVRILLRTSGGDYELRIQPQAGASNSVLKHGDKTTTLKTVTALSGQTVRFEIAVPWRTLGMTPKNGSIVGCDLFWTDVDMEEGLRTEGTLRWAGGSTSGGYLWLR